MQTTKNYSTNPTHPTDAMNYNDFLDGATCDDLSPFDAFMGYDGCGNSMRLDEHTFKVIRNIESGTTIGFDDFFDASFTDLLWPEEEQRLMLDLIMFTQRFSAALGFLSIDERHHPVFLVK